MTSDDDIDGRAAEYVLGTLDFDERTKVAERRLHEPKLDAAIQAWERRLGPLSDLARPIEPQPGLWKKIERRLEAGDRGLETLTRRVDTVVILERRVQRWRRAAVAASVLAASLVVAVVLRELDRPSVPKTFVAVFQGNDASPAFLLTLDLAQRTLTVRPVSAQTPPGKAYELWIVDASLGDKPKSLGLLAAQGFTTRAVLATVNTTIAQTATYGVSLEPSGGSPTGQPTGPVLLAQLIQSTP